MDLLEFVDSAAGKRRPRGIVEIDEKVLKGNQRAYWDRTLEPMENGAIRFL